MAFPLAWVVLAAVIVTVFLFSSALVKHYSDPADSSFLLTVAAALGLTTALLCVLLVPIDIYTVSSSLSAEGYQLHPTQVESAGHSLKSLYYILYCSLFGLAFLVLPFCYFFFEEEDDGSPLSSRVCGALKYTVLFVLLFGILLGLGLVLKNGRFDSNHSKNDKWVDDLKGDFNAGDAIVTFVVSTLATLGLVGWLGYVSYGLVFLPVSILRSTGSEDPEDELKVQLASTESQIETLSARYDTSEGHSRSLSSPDRHRLLQLRRTQKRLQALGDTRPLRESRCERCLDCFWNLVAPLRWVIGITLLLVSLLVVTSLALSTADKYEHSECRSSCGFALQHARFVNPLDKSLKFLSKYFPVDLFVFAGLVLFFFLCAVAALASVGVRLICWKLYDLVPHRSMPHALVFGVWLLMFTVLALNMELTTLAPDYVTYGDQFYFTYQNGTRHKHACSTSFVLNSTAFPGRRQCVMTQVARFVNSAQLAVPFFGDMFYYANYGFGAFFLLSAIIVACRKKRSKWREMEDDHLDAGFTAADKLLEKEQKQRRLAEHEQRHRERQARREARRQGLGV